MKKYFNYDLLQYFSIKQFSLKFKDEYSSLEKDFKKEYLIRSAKYTRTSLIIGIIFYSLFGILDAVIIPDQKYSLWFIRFAVVIPAVVFLLILSMINPFKKYMELIGAAALVIAGGGISCMVAIAAPPANYSYYAGVILVLMLGYGFVRIRFKWASIAGWLNVLIYEIISIYLVKTPWKILLNNNFFFISANLIGMLSCYAVEFYIRQNFIMSKLLETEKENVNNLNKNLEKNVNERTREIITVNKELQAEIIAHNNAETERNILEQKLFQAQKMESIGNLAGGIAHDFNNILSSIMGFTELSLQLVENDFKLKKYLEQIYISGERAAELVNQILSFARKSEKNVRPVRPDKVLYEVLKLLHSSLPSTIEIKQTISSCSFIMGNETQIHQIFMNLFTNSAHAINKERGIIEIKMNDIEIIQENYFNNKLKSGKYIQIEISDTGDGISEEILDSIFEPYFTTKNTGDGTGLGLAVVLGIIESYNGDIKIESTVGKGSQITIYLPVTDKILDHADAEEEKASTGNERILLVDDELSIIDFLKNILSSLGYIVTSMTSSLDAFTIFQENPYNFDLIITDMTMPMMNGADLCQKISKIREDIPVIMCSGYNKEYSEFICKNVKSYINKPFTKSHIANEIRRVLEQ